MMLDYVYTDDIKEAISELTGKDEELRGYDKPDTGDKKQGVEIPVPPDAFRDDA